MGSSDRRRRLALLNPAGDCCERRRRHKPLAPPCPRRQKTNPNKPIWVNAPRFKELCKLLTKRSHWSYLACYLSLVAGNGPIPRSYVSSRTRIGPRRDRFVAHAQKRTWNVTWNQPPGWRGIFREAGSRRSGRQRPRCSGAVLSAEGSRWRRTVQGRGWGHRLYSRRRCGALGLRGGCRL